MTSLPARALRAGRLALAAGAAMFLATTVAQAQVAPPPGIDIDYCRAIAAAVLGDPDKVKFTGTTAAARFTVLQAGEIDVLIRDSTLTFTRSTVLGLDEVAINF